MGSTSTPSSSVRRSTGGITIEITLRPQQVTLVKVRLTDHQKTKKRVQLIIKARVRAHQTIRGHQTIKPVIKLEMVDRVVLDTPTVLHARAVDNRSKAKIMDQDMSDHNLQVVTDQNVQLVTDQNAQVVTDQNAQLEAELAREEEVEDPTNEISE